MKIVFLTRRNIYSPSEGFSQYCMAKAIKESIGELIPLIHPQPIRKYSYKWFIGKIFPGAWRNPDSKVNIRDARAIEKRLKNIDYDLLFAPMGSDYISELKLDKPIVYLSDSTYMNMNGYYFPRKDLDDPEFKEKNSVEKHAYDRAARIVLSNNWAYDSVIKDYEIDPKKVSVVYSGPNLDSIPVAEELGFPTDNDKLNVLMIGRDWERKGGQYGVELIEEAKARGIEAKLTICGMVPPGDYDKSCIEVYPFLDKKREQDYRKLLDIFSRSHFLLFPSRAECHGLATNEANALGLPVIANRTGGIPDYIIPGINGDLVDPEMGADKYLDLSLIHI